MRSITRTVIPAVLVLASAISAHAHLGYTGRDFLTFGTTSQRYVSITQTTNTFGWADGTDSDWGQQDRQRYFRFTLSDPTLVYISVQAANPSLFLPGFSLFRGLGQTDASEGDNDGAPITQAYLATLGVTKEGAFNALGDWKIGNGDDSEPGATTFDFSRLSSLTYIGNAADGTSANYGPAAGINGDGAADGFVTATFSLPAGDYTLVVGGAKYADQSITTNSHSFTTTVTNIPEPTTAAAVLIGTAALAGLRRRRARG